MVGELEYPKDLESYAAGSVATGRVTLGGQVEMVGVRLREAPWSSRLGVERRTDSGLTLRPWKKFLVTKTTGGKTGLMEGQQLGRTWNRKYWRRNEFYLGTWNVLSLYQAGALRLLLDQIDKYKTGIITI